VAGERIELLRKTVSGIMLTLFLIGMLTLAFNIQPVKAEGTIYIRADGSIDPPTAPIQRNGDVYTLTANIIIDVVADGIVVERSSIIVDGAGYTLQGSGLPWEGNGFDCSGINNVTIRNTNIEAFYQGILLYQSSNNSICENNITNNEYGIKLTNNEPYYSNYNSFTGNNITNNDYGIVIRDYCSYNSIIENNITVNSICGVAVGWSSNYNSIFGNNITNSDYGIRLYSSLGNMIYHNDFIDNSEEAWDDGYSVTVWDDGYPSGGNYWSDYAERYPGAEELDGSGIWDTPYVIDETNQDNYPLIHPYGAPAPKITDIDPSQPIASAGKQLLTILGEGFVPNSEVNLSIGSTPYPIPPERTSFISANKIEIIAGLGAVPGLWKALVTNPVDIQSNEYAFEVRSVSDEDIMKVLALALQYTTDPYEWTVEDAVIMTAIAGGESGWNPNVAFDEGDYPFNYMGYDSWGLWQIFMDVHKDKLGELGAPIDDPSLTAKWLLDPNNNVKAAYAVWEEADRIWGDGFRPWSVYTQKNAPNYYKNPSIWNRMINVAKQIGISVFQCPVNVTITDNYGRVISEVENQIPGASFEYFNATDTKIFYLPLNLTYNVQLNATDYGNCTIIQITPLDSVYEIAFSRVEFNLTSETVAEFDLLPYDANYTLKVDEDGDGLIDYELTPEVVTMTTEYDVGVTEIVPSKTIIGQGYNLPISITITNYGAHTETFNITLYANTTSITTQTVTLTSGNSTIITFTWNTAGFTNGNYTISAVADTVPGETDIEDNTCAGSIVTVTIPGDVDGDFDVDLYDAVGLLVHYGAKQGSPEYDHVFDIDSDGDIDLYDAVILLTHYGQKYP
jgi:parallel beta-helix repeat protein